MTPEQKQAARVRITRKLRDLTRRHEGMFERRADVSREDRNALRAEALTLLEDYWAVIEGDCDT